MPDWEEIAERLRGFPPALDASKFSFPVDEFHYRALDDNYSFALDAASVVAAVAATNGDRRHKQYSVINLVGPNQLLKIETDDKGRQLLTHGPLIEALLGVDIRRIRECPICGNFYWAGRIDQPGCSGKCTGTLRTRRWRNNYPERYKLRRIEAAVRNDLPAYASGVSEHVGKRLMDKGDDVAQKAPSRRQPPRPKIGTRKR
jgi:hypothetical protein